MALTSSISFLFSSAGLYQWIGFNWTTWSVLSFLFAIIYWSWCNSRYVRLIEAIPGPKGWPIIGSILDIMVDRSGNKKKTFKLTTSQWIWMNILLLQSFFELFTANGFPNTAISTADGAAVGRLFASLHPSSWKYVTIILDKILLFFISEFSV